MLENNLLAPNPPLCLISPLPEACDLYQTPSFAGACSPAFCCTSPCSLLASPASLGTLIFPGL